MAAGVMPWLICPRCRADLAAPVGDRLVCGGCGAAYETLLGIPDLRIQDGPYISNRGDWEKARHLAARYSSSRFEDLVALYYQLTPEVPPADARRFTQALLAAPERARATLTSWHDLGGEIGPHTGLFADVGCGTAPMLVAAAGQGREAVGFDVSLRWLVIARKRLEEAGLAVPLVCANAESLPVRDSALGVVAFDSALEHFRDGKAAIREAARVLAPEGRLMVSTPNRHSLGPDPHLGVWAGGWWPDAVTRWLAQRRGALMPERRLVDPSGLRGWLAAGGFRAVNLGVPAVSPIQLNGLSFVGRSLAVMYNRARRWPIAGALLAMVGPILHAVAMREGPRPAGDR